MGSSQDQNINIPTEEEELLKVIQLLGKTALPMVLRTAIELDLFEIMAKAGAQFSSSEIASHLHTQNPETPSMLERMLRFLASNSILTCTLTTDEDGHDKRLYGMAPICKYFVRDQHGVSLAPMYLFLQDKVIVDCWYHMKDAMLEGGIPFNKAHGLDAFEYLKNDTRFSDIFNKAMYNHTMVAMKLVLEKYKGFEGVEVVVDVGGGFGAMLNIIASKYPNIRGINFDLPHVIKDAPPCPGVEHVGGDMFQSVPKGEVIFMKWILHDWGDDYCLKLLKNCWNALPEGGKVVVMDSMLPEQQPTSDSSEIISDSIISTDIVMMAINPAAKERTQKEFEALATKAGFIASKIICRAWIYWIMEFYK